MKIRTAELNDLPVIFDIGSRCFPLQEAATEKAYKERLEIFPTHFWVLEDNNVILAFINGMVTNESEIRDEMYDVASLHSEDGAWQAIFGVCTSPEYRKHGYAAKIMEQVITDAKKQSRRGCILTCKKELIHYYEKFGFKNNGISQSVLAGEVWYDMCLVFEPQKINGGII